MSLDHVFHLVDEFGRAMRDDAKQPGSISADDLNQQRLRLQEAIRKLAGTVTPQEALATRAAVEAIETAARPLKPAPVTSNLTTDHNDPRLTRGHDETPRPQAEAYVVLSEDERAKGFVRTYRDAYKHDTCGTITTMGRALSETYARDPKFYDGTYCVKCQMHRPVAEFRWYEMDGTIGPVVGS